MISFLSLSPSLLSFPFPPPDWEEEQVSSPNILRLIFQGRFLHGNVTLGGENNTPSIRSSVHLSVHLHRSRFAGACGWKLRRSRFISFLKGRTEAAQCSGQTRFESRREERSHTEGEGLGRREKKEACALQQTSTVKGHVAVDPRCLFFTLNSRINDLKTHLLKKKTLRHT